MSNFEADARVVVRADTKPFRTETLKAIEAFEKVPVRIKLVPDPRGFLTALRKAVDAAAIAAPARIRLVADPTGFKASLRKAVAEATAGEAVPVKVAPTGGGRPATGTTTAGGGRAPSAAPIQKLTEAQKALQKATDLSVFARKKLDSSLSVEEKRAEALRRELLALKAAQTAVEKATLDANGPLLAQAEILRRQAQAAVQKREATIAKAAEPERRAAEAAAAEAAAAKKLQADISNAHKEAIAEDKVRTKAAVDAANQRMAAMQTEAIAADNLRTQNQKAAQAEVDASKKAAVAATNKELDKIEADRAARLADAGKKRALFFKEQEAAEKAAIASSAALEKQEVEASRKRVAAAEAAASAQAAGLQKVATAQQAINRAEKSLSGAQTFRGTGLNLEAKAKAELAEATIVVKKAEDAFKATIGTSDRVLQRQAISVVRNARAFKEMKEEALAAAIATDAVATASAKVNTATAQIQTARDFKSKKENPVARAREELAVATNATKTAETAFTKAVATSDTALKAHAADTLLDARALEVRRQELLANAIAEQKLAASQATQAALDAKRRGAAVRGFGAQLATFAKLRGAVLAANGPFIAGTVAAIAFGKAVAEAASFESELNVFKVVAGATADEMEKVSATARQLGADITLPGVSAVDAAQSLQQLSKAGLSLEDSLAGARGVLQLATAAQISNAEATLLTASALNAFSLSGDQAVRVADILTNAANAAQGEITDMGIALQQSSAVARQVGLSLEDTATFLTLLARAGIRGSDAGTSLRVALTRLIAPTDQAAAVMEKLNIQVRDAEGNLRPDIFNQIAEAQKNLSRAQQDANAKIIFGVDALRAYSIISRESRAGIAQVESALREQGSAAELANARMTGLRGSAENLKNQISSLGITIGQVLIPPLKIVADGFAIFVKMINDSLTVIGKMIGLIPKLIEELKDLGSLKIGPFDFGAPLAPLDKLIGDLDEKIADSFKGFDPDDAGIEDVIGRLNELRSESERFQQSGGFIPPRITKESNDLVRQLIQMGEAIRKTGSNNRLNVLLQRFVDASPQVKAAWKDGIITPSEKAELALSHVGAAFLRFVPKDAFIGLAASVRSGIEDATHKADDGITNMGAHIRSGVEDASREAAAAAAAGGAAIGKAFVDALAKSIQGLSGRLSGLEREALDIQIAGGPQEQQKLLDNLEKQERLARDKLAKRKAQRARGEIGNEPVRAAQEELNEILDKQDQIRESMAADAEREKSEAQAAADKIQKALDDADKAVLDAFGRRSEDFDARAFQADQSETLKDDLSIEKQRKKFLFSRIAFFRRTIKNAEILRDALRKVRDALRAVDAEIASLEKQIADDQKEAARKARDAITETLGKKIQLAELGGNRDAILSAYDAAIADARKRVKNAKKLGLVLIDEQIALAQLVKDRQEFLNETKDALKGGTTAFDLLSQFTDTFNQVSGNLISSQMPFVSPADFTSPIAPFLTRKPTDRNKISFDTGGMADSTDRAIERLIRALEDNTAATKGNSATNTGEGFSMQRYTNVTGQRAQAMAKFWEARGAREWQDSSGGRGGV